MVVGGGGERKGFKDVPDQTHTFVHTHTATYTCCDQDVRHKPVVNIEIYSVFADPSSDACNTVVCQGVMCHHGHKIGHLSLLSRDVLKLQYTAAVVFYVLLLVHACVIELR